LYTRSEKHLETMLLPPLRSMLFKLDRMEGVSEKVKTGIRVLQCASSRGVGRPAGGRHPYLPTWSVQGLAEAVCVS
jgi:hypothetical protein